MSFNSTLKELERSEKHTLAIMDRVEGDYKVTWDPDDDTDVDMARASFNAAKKKGLVAFKVKKDGSKGERIREFDPEAEAIIMAPALQGG